MVVSSAVKQTIVWLKDKLGKNNLHQSPKVTKVVVAMGIWSLVTRKGFKDFAEFEKNIRMITGQKPVIVKAKKSVSNFKLREGMPVMLRVTLRQQKAYDFIDRLTKIVLPRVRDFDWLSQKSFDAHGNYSMGLKNYAIFPELGLDDVTVPMWLQVTIDTTAESPDDAKILLESLWIIFKK